MRRIGFGRHQASGRVRPGVDGLMAGLVEGAAPGARVPAQRASHGPEALAALGGGAHRRLLGWGEAADRMVAPGRGQVGQEACGYGVAGLPACGRGADRLALGVPVVPELLGGWLGLDADRAVARATVDVGDPVIAPLAAAVQEVVAKRLLAGSGEPVRVDVHAQLALLGRGERDHFGGASTRPVDGRYNRAKAPRSDV